MEAWLNQLTSVVSTLYALVLVLSFSACLAENPGWLNPGFNARKRAENDKPCTVASDRHLLLMGRNTTKRFGFAKFLKACADWRGDDGAARKGEKP